MYFNDNPYQAMISKHDNFTLANFEGPLDFLLCLIQKEEIDIYDIPIQDLIHQFILKLTEWKSHVLDRGAEFIGTAAYLVWLKSQTLLPQEEQTLNFEEIIEDPHFEIIHHLIDYCRFKNAAKELSLRQEKQQACYFRGVEMPEWKKPLGINHVTLEELEHLFKEMMGRAPQAISQIHEEFWRVSDKISLIRSWLQERTSFPLVLLLSPQLARMELIVTFLAVLELMKIGELCVGREPDSLTLLIVAREKEVN